MPLLDHLGELRRRLTIIIVAVIIGTAVFYFATPTIIDLLTDPIAPFVGGKFYIMSSLGGFSLRFSIAIKTAAVVCVPIILWQILGFFLPALKPKERRWVVPTVAAMVLLFFLGMVFCFFIIQPAAFGWLLEQSLEIGALMPEASDYLDIYMLLEIGFGIAFQLPLVIFYLSVLHLVPYKTFRSQWRIVYVAFMVLSAVVTPDASPVTMVLMFAILILLYEAALAVSRFIIVARDGREALKWGREDFENRKLDQE